METSGIIYSDRIVILDLSEVAQFEELKRRLWPRRKDPPTPVIKLLKLVSVCRTAVVELDYVDRDHRLSYSRLYNFRHADTDRRCTRIHFFSCEVPAQQLDNMSLTTMQGYRGFTVVRPLPTNRLGRTILSPLLFPRYKELAVYLTCRAEYRVNLVGNVLFVVAVPWMEQEQMISRCASAALWLASWHLSHKFGPEFRMFHTPEITDLATEAVLTGGRGIPSNYGLSVDQMMYAIRGMGYEPVIDKPETARDARKRIYTYVESGLPVFIHLGSIRRNPRVGHIVVVMGHTYDSSLRDDKLTDRIVVDERSLGRMSDFAPGFVVQDDERGPFGVIRLADLSSLNVEAPYDMGGQQDKPVALMDIDDDSDPWSEPWIIEALIVALPPGVSLDVRDAEDWAAKLLVEWYEASGQTLPDDIVLRTFLQPSTIMKSCWREDRGVAPALSRFLRTHSMPRWIWVTEVARLGMLREQGRIIGQIVQDSAAHANDVLLLQLPGRLQWTDAQNKEQSMTMDDVTLPKFEREETAQAYWSGLLSPADVSEAV